MSSPKRRIETDVMKLMMSGMDVSLVNDNMMEFLCNFKGPQDSPYENGCWKVKCQLPEGYPYKSPSIGFLNKIYHPNIDEMSGSVCLDVINQSWSPMFDLMNIFETFLPQLLMYPNPSDPLNGEAAALMMREPDRYKAKIKDYVKKYATLEAMLAAGNNESDEGSTSSESEMSDMDDLSGVEDNFEMEN